MKAFIDRGREVPCRNSTVSPDGHLELIVSGLIRIILILLGTVQLSVSLPPVVLAVRNPPADAGCVRDVGLILRWGQSPGGGYGNPLQDSCLENSSDREVWRAVVHGVAKGQIGLR